MRSNFDFLNENFPVLARFGKTAEEYLYSDSNSCLMQLGMIGETIVNLMFTYDRINFPQENSAVDRINVLAREGLLTRDLVDIFHALRKVRNKAVHENYESVSDGKALLQMAYSLCEWFMQTYGDWNYQNRPFVMPLDTPKPVFKYTYREAVIEGYWVDHDAPHRLSTKLSAEGIHYRKGDTVVRYDPVTGEVTNSELLEDELDFDVDAFNRQVITEPFNRTILAEIARDIDPESPDVQGKTLIFAVNDDHAYLIVKILKEIYAEMGVDNDAIMKITGSVGGGNKKKVKGAIKRFKNERFPSVVVTVDLLTTGINVPSITTLVFMRCVKSRILFEQMMGRATRRCPEIHKTHFEIYDPVGVYDSLEVVSTMKPVVANPSATFEQLLDGLEVLEDERQVENQVDQIVAKLQRQKRRMDAETMEQFISMTGGQDTDQFISDIQQRKPEDAKNRLLAHTELFKMLAQFKPDARCSVVISDHENELLEHSRGYGKGSRPEDYLDAFADYVKTNLNESVLNTTVFDEDGRFKAQGGFEKINKVFRNKLESIILELNEYLYDDGGKIA